MPNKKIGMTIPDISSNEVSSNYMCDEENSGSILRLK